MVLGCSDSKDSVGFVWKKMMLILNGRLKNFTRVMKRIQKLVGKIEKSAKFSSW